MQLLPVVKLEPCLAKGSHPDIMHLIMLLRHFDEWITKLLSLSEYEEHDSSLNGLQVDRSDPEIKKIAFAVDASMESFRRAAEAEANLIFVHHGLYWGSVLPIRDRLYSRIRFLMDNDIALYAVHLPLDSHSELGNNAQIARRLAMQDIEPFGTYRGMKIGFKGSLAKSARLEEITRKVCMADAAGSLPFGPSDIRSIGIISGDCPEGSREAIDQGLDLYITGESSHEIYHDCLEGGLNVLFVGHYQSEIWGIEALADFIKTDSDIQTTVLNVPTGW